MTWRDDLIDTSTDPDVAARVIAAIEALLEQDGYLLEIDVHERTISHRLGIYLEGVFPDWNVDCEYNRDGHEPKEIPAGSGDDGEQGSRVFPDIIVHRRGTHRNHIVIEVKKSSNREGDVRDQMKLAAYRGALAYEHALFVCFVVGRHAPEVSRAYFVQNN